MFWIFFIFYYCFKLANKCFPIKFIRVAFFLKNIHVYRIQGIRFASTLICYINVLTVTNNG